MTPAQADARLSAAERGARSYGDATYASAVDLADPGDVQAADDEVSAGALQREFLELAEEMQPQDVDAQTIGDAMDMVGAEAEVADAARNVTAAERQLADTQEQLATQGDDPSETAQEDARAARDRLERARTRLREELDTAADIASRMREGLRRRHGGLSEAHQSAPVRAAGRDFY